MFVATSTKRPLFDRCKPAAEKPWSASRTGILKLWIYDLRTNKHFTLKENPLKRSDLDDFVACYNPKHRHERKESERFKSFTYEELTKRDKLNLDIFWLKDESLEDSQLNQTSDVRYQTSEGTERAFGEILIVI
jgi:type I restriction enzyme M protein